MPKKKRRNVRCPYCGHDAELVDSAEIYRGRSYGLAWLCRPCEAYVGCHQGTARPLGEPANKATREARMRAHAAFDAIWKPSTTYGRDRQDARRTAYRWLAAELGIDPYHCHIGQFDVETCRRVVEVCEARNTMEQLA